MDAKPEAGAGEKKAAVAPRDAAPSSPRAAAAEAPLSGDAAGAEGGLPANVDQSGAAAVEEDDDEQQAMERFYALVANVRAMRGMYRSSGDGASADSGTSGDADGSAGGGGERKRARRADQPWRPVFRMEDFADVAGAAPTKSARADDGARVPPIEQAAGVEGNDDVELTRGRRAAASTTPPPP